MTEEDRPKCLNPRNYGKECSSENCPDINEWGNSTFDILIATADGYCEYGSWCQDERREREKKKN